MSIFSRKKRFGLGNNSENRSASDDIDFDLGDMDDMSGEFGDDHQVSTDRKASIKNFVTEHYGLKVNERSEQQRLIRGALPSSYSTSVDLAYDLKDDYDRIKYDVSKELDKSLSPLKRVIRSNKKWFKGKTLGKIADWSEDSGGSSYQEDLGAQEEATVQSMLAEFTSGRSKESNETDERRIEEYYADKEEASDYRTKSLSAQLRGVAAGGNTVSELKKLTDYQDQVTFLFQKKSLEIGIRSLLEHRKQTDLLRVYKEESILELKEIHKNTGLPEVVKITQNELATQVFKEKMLGKATEWFDGKLSPIRKRITTRIRDSLIEMTKNFGTSLESFSEAASIGEDGGEDAVSTFGKILASMGLDRAWEQGTKKPLEYARGKLSGNSKINRVGNGLNALSGGLGSTLNTALLEGSTGNSIIDKLSDWAGLSQAAITRDDSVQGSLKNSLDTAVYMDARFKQTVERVIPKWLSLIYKETHLTRLGHGFKEGDGKKGTIAYEDKEWDWDNEDVVDSSISTSKLKTKLIDKDKVKNYSESLERLLRHIGVDTLTKKSTIDKVKKWVIDRVQGSKSCTHYDLLLTLDNYKEDEKEDIKVMVALFSGLDFDEIDEETRTGQYRHVLSLFNGKNPHYAKWIRKYNRLYSDFSGKSIVPYAEIKSAIENGQASKLVDIGYVKINEDGSKSIDMDFASSMAFDLSEVKRKPNAIKYKRGEDRTRKNSRGNSVAVPTYEFDEESSDVEIDEYLFGDDIELSDRVNAILDGRETVGTRSAKDKIVADSLRAKKLKELLSDGKGYGSLGGRRAAGGFIGRFAGGGATDMSAGGYTGDTPIDQPVHAVLDGKEFVTDATATERNKGILSSINKLKASVVMPDGTVNPVYYKAFGFDTEEEFRDARNSDRSYAEKTVARAVKQDGALPYIQSLVESIDLSKLSNAQIEKLADPNREDASKIRLLANIKAKQNQKTIGDVVRGGLKASLKIANADYSGARGKVALNRHKLNSESRKLYGKFRAGLNNKSEKQLEKLFNSIAKNTDTSIIKEEDMVFFESSEHTWKEKVERISDINFNRGNRGKFVGKALTKWTKDINESMAKRAKILINGSKTDTTITDELGKIGSKLKGKGGSAWSKIKDKTMVSADYSVGDGVEFNYYLDEKRLQTAFTVDDMKSGVLFYITPKSELSNDARPKINFVRKFQDIPGTPKEIVERGIRLRIVDNPDSLPAEAWANALSLVKSSKTVWLNPGFKSDHWFDQSGEELDIRGFIQTELELSNKREFVGFNRKARGEIADYTVEKLRLKKASELALKVWKDEAVDVYLLSSPETPRLTAIGFVSGDYIDSETGRVCRSHHDITGPVVNRNNEVLINAFDFESGFIDKDGNLLQISQLRRARNIAKEKTSAAYNKYAKKHVDRFTGGLLSATEKWQNIFKKTAIDVYVGSATEPALTAIGFKDRSYFSVATKKPLKGYLDIDGPVMDINGTYLISLDDLEKKFLFDKDGNRIKPPKLQSNLLRFRDVILTSLGFGVIKKLGTKLLNKAKGFSAKKSLDNFNKLGQKAVDVYIDGKPVLLAIDFKAGRLLDAGTGKPLSNHYQIKGAVLKVTEGEDMPEIVLSKEMVERGGFTDALGEPLPVIDIDLLRGGIVKGVGRGIGKSLVSMKDSFMSGFKRFDKDKGDSSDDLSPEEDTDGDGKRDKAHRQGSWQKKRADKEKDSWIGKLVNAFGFGDDDNSKPKKKKKKGLVGALLSGIGKIVAPIFMGLNMLGGVITKTLFKVGGTIVGGLLKGLPRLTKFVAGPIIRGLGSLGTMLVTAIRGNGMMGKFGGKGVKSLGRAAMIAGGAYMAYDGLKGEEKLDENGNPILDENGDPVVERSYGKAALGTALSAAGVLTIPGAAAAIGTAGTAVMTAGAGLATGAAALLAPVAVPLAIAAGATLAAVYGTRKLYGWWKGSVAKKKYPLAGFRMNQYGFEISDQDVAEKIMKLEQTLAPYVSLGGSKGANFKNDVDTKAVFSIFGLDFENGDKEKNKVFLQWFLGRFKPVYLAYATAMNEIKKGVSLQEIDDKLTASESLKLIESSHFKNQSTLNPYNFMMSPFDDPDECEFDYDDVCGRYVKLSKKLSSKIKASDKKANNTKPEEGEEEKTEEGKSLAAKALEFSTRFSVGGIALHSLKQLGDSYGEVLTKVSNGLGKTVTKMWDGWVGAVNSKIESFKKTLSTIRDIIANPFKAAKDLATKGGKYVKDRYDTAVDYTSRGIESAANFGGKVKKVWSNLTGKRGETQTAVYDSFVKAGLTPNQAMAITAEVGRENDYDENVIYGSHIDPAARGGKSVKNLGMISWNGSRGEKLAKKLSSRGLLDANGKMVKSQEALDTQAEFAVEEMSTTYAKRLNNFWSNPNGDPESFSKELGKNYVVWAYGQNDIAAKGGGRKPFNWGEHDQKRRDYLNKMGVERETSSPEVPAMLSRKAPPFDTTSNGSGDLGSIANLSRSVNLSINRVGKSWDLDKICDYATRNSKGSYTAGMKVGRCAEYVRKALQAGDIKKQIPGGCGHAYQLGGFIESIGWERVGDINSVTPKKGDIAVFDRGSYMSGGKSTPYGHICIFNGVSWISDFTQATVYPNSKMASQNIRHRILRATDGVSSGKVVASSSLEEKQPNQIVESMVANNDTVSPAVGFNSVLDRSGRSNTDQVAVSQRADAMNSAGVASILSKQLAVQTEMKSVLVEIRDHIKSTSNDKAKREMDKLKRAPNIEDTSSAIAGNIADLLSNKLGLNNKPDKPKPSPVISASK